LITLTKSIDGQSFTVMLAVNRDYKSLSPKTMYISVGKRK